VSGAARLSFDGLRTSGIAIEGYDTDVERLE